MEVLNSGAASSFAAAVGLFWVPRLLPSAAAAQTAPDHTIDRNWGWILGAAAVAVFYIAVLGPGIKAAL
jgi:hypothetical protein